MAWYFKSGPAGCRNAVQSLRMAIELASLTCRFVDSDRILCETRMTNCTDNRRRTRSHTYGGEYLGGNAGIWCPHVTEIGCSWPPVPPGVNIVGQSLCTLISGHFRCIFGWGLCLPLPRRGVGLVGLVWFALATTKPTDFYGLCELHQ